MGFILQKDMIRGLINQLLKIKDAMSCVSTDEAVEQGRAMHKIILEITSMIFQDNHISAVYDWNPYSDGKEKFLKEFDKWYDFVDTTMQQLENIKNITETEFYLLMRYLKAATEEEIQELIKRNLENLKESDNDFYQGLLYVYSVFKSYWGELNPENGVYDCINQRAHALKEHIEEWEWLYENLCDIRSKKVLYNILMNWLTFDLKWLTASIENVYGDYFDLDLIPETMQEEVFVDLGGYIGDTVTDFVQCYSGRYKRVYTYEINKDNYAKLIENIREYRDIVPRKVAAGEKEGRMFASMETGGGPATVLAESGEEEIAVVALDDDIKEPVTWIKMDIEGAEQAALRGCRRHIENEKPKLTISTYHNNEDIWKIPKMVKEYNEDYKLYLRYNGHSCWPADYVLFAL